MNHDRAENLAATAKEQAATIRELGKRWQHCLTHGFPVRNQTARTRAVQWIAVVGDGTIEYGETPDEALDAALAKEKPDD